MAFSAFSLILARTAEPSLAAEEKIVGLLEEKVDKGVELLSVVAAPAFTEVVLAEGVDLMSFFPKKDDTFFANFPAT